MTVASAVAYNEKALLKCRKSVIRLSGTNDEKCFADEYTLFCSIALGHAGTIAD